MSNYPRFLRSFFQADADPGESIAAHYSGGPRTFTCSYLPGTDLVDSAWCSAWQEDWN